MTAARKLEAQSTPAVVKLLDHAIAALGRGDRVSAADLYRTALRHDPGNFTALANLGVIACQTGDFAEGVRRLAEAVERRPDDKPVRDNLALALSHLADHYAGRRDFVNAALAMRRLVRLDPRFDGAQGRLLHTLYYSGLAASLADVAPALEPAQLGRKVLLACMPKSGSSWLVNALQRLTGFPQVPLAAAYLQNEQEIDLPLLVKHAARDAVVQQHCRATAANVQLLQAFGITPVVLVRNIYDVLVSLADFWASGAVKNTFLYRDFATMERGRQLDAVIDTMAPWYVQFFASWTLAEAEGRLPVLWLTYEGMMRDKPGALASVARLGGIEKSPEEVAAAVAASEADHSRNRFNRGVTGRGAAEMTKAQKKRISRIAGHYPSIDFARIGLPAR